MYQIKDFTTKHYALCVVDLFSFLAYLAPIALWALY